MGDTDLIQKRGWKERRVQLALSLKACCLITATHTKSPSVTLYFSPQGQLYQVSGFLNSKFRVLFISILELECFTLTRFPLRSQKLGSRKRKPLAHFCYLHFRSYRASRTPRTARIALKEDKFALKGRQCCISAELQSSSVLHCANCICHPCRARGGSTIMDRRGFSAFRLHCLLLQAGIVN